MKRVFIKTIIMTMLISLNVVVLVSASGCAAKPDCMVPAAKEFTVLNHHPYTVSVNESKGGINPKPLWHSEISNAAFTEALNRSLVKSSVFQDVIIGGGVDKSRGADYILDVTILGYDRPSQGANLTIDMETKWQLTDAQTRTCIWSNTFKTSHRTPWGKSIFDGERIELAHEAAVRTNIKEGIRRLSLLNL